MKVLYQGCIPPFDVLLVVMFQSAPVFRKLMLECLEGKRYHMCPTWQSKFGKMLAFGDAGLKVFRSYFTLFVTFLKVQIYFKTGLSGSSVSVCVRGDTHTGSHGCWEDLRRHLMEHAQTRSTMRSHSSQKSCYYSSSETKSRKSPPFMSFPPRKLACPHRCSPA